MRRRVRLRACDGASAAEFVLIAPLLVLLLFGIVVFSIAFNRVQGMQAASREAARLASVGAPVDHIRDRATDSLVTVFKDPDDPDVPLVPVVSVVRLDDDDNETVMSSDGDVACDELVPTAEKVRVTVSVDADAHAITIPFFGPVSSTYESQAVFKCE